jgi:hypothetical protein
MEEESKEERVEKSPEINRNLDVHVEGVAESMPEGE